MDAGDPDPRVLVFRMPDSATHPSASRSASSGAGIDVTTLFLTACASAAAAYTCSKIWAPGTLASAAFTPVLVAVIKEALAKPTQAVARAVPVRGVVRSASAGEPGHPEASWSAASGGEQLGGDHAPAAPYADPAARVAQPGEIQYHGTGRRMRGWRLAIVTGLLGFLICAVVFTVPELVAGGSAAGGGRETTLFGGGRQHNRPAPAVTTQTTTTTTPERTQTQPVTVPPTETVTVPPAQTTAVPPAQTTTVPTTPAPQEPGVGQPPAAQPPG
jgi:hypothetical protein